MSNCNVFSMLFYYSDCVLLVQSRDVTKRKMGKRREARMRRGEGDEWAGAGGGRALSPLMPSTALVPIFLSCPQTEDHERCH